MKRSILLLSFILGIFISINAQVTQAKFLIEYNDATSLYDCKIVIAEGETSTYPHRIIFNTQYSIVVPTGTTLEIAELHAPWENNATYTGTKPTLWEFGPKELSPPIQPQHDFYTVIPNLSPTGAFNDLYTVDTVTLFSVFADVDPCENAIRPFENGIDPSSLFMPSGGDFSCGVTIGSEVQIYSGNLSTFYAVSYISPNDSLVTCMNDCISLEPYIFCLGDSLKYEWSTGETTETIEVCPAEPTDYYVWIKDKNDNPLDTITVHVGFEALIIDTPNSTVCAGNSIILEACPGSGTWSQTSANGFGAVLDSISEGVTEVSFNSFVSGTFDFVFSIPGLFDTVQITVSPKPLVNIAASYICVNGTTEALANIPGGTWVSNDPSVATIVHNTGDVTGHSAGNVTLTYTAPTGCSTTTSSLQVISGATVSITGSDKICVGGTTFVSPTNGGTWESADNSVATISNAGVVTGVGQGVATLIFTETVTGCSSEGLNIEVSAMPEAVFIGPDSICINGISSISPSSGGTWVSSNPLVATIDNSGNITAHNIGTTVFTYNNNLPGCSSITSETFWVIGEPDITTIFDTELCIGETTQALPAVNGTWISDNPAVATITAGGLITGVAAGKVRFTFTNSSTSCMSDPSVEVTVNGVPEVSLLGHNEICIGGTSQMLPSSGGIWTSSDPSIISIDNNGVFTANAVGGPVSFTWTDDLSGCTSNPSEPVFASLTISTELTGPDQICIGGTTTIEPSVGGTWSSANDAIATIDNIGNITGVGIGVTQFVFTSAAGLCHSDPSVLVQVNPGPTISVPSTSLCEDETMNLTPTSGGTWTSSNPSAYVNSPSGLVTAYSEGTVTFTFTDENSGCSTTSEVVTIHGKPVIEENNPFALCTNISTTVNSNVEGLWTSSNPSIVSVTNSGQITTLSEGIAYLVSTDIITGCESDPLQVIVADTVPTPSPSNNGPLCEGEEIQLTTDFLPGAYYKWTGPNGYSAFGQNKKISNASLLDAGTYCVVVSYSPCSSLSACTEVVINPSPATPIASSNGPICEGEDLELMTDAVTNATYAWTGPNGFASYEQNPVITAATYANGGSYCVVVTVDGCDSMEGCTDVEPDCPCPIMNNTITQPDPNEFCGESEALTILGSDALPNGGSYVWEYSLDGGVFVPVSGISDQRDYTTGILGVGEHRFRRVYTIETSIDCEDISNEILIIVYESANAGFDQSLDCFFNSIVIMEASGVGIWSWGSTPSAAAIIIDVSDPNTEIIGFESPGEYNLIWTTYEGCTDEVSIVVGDYCPCPIMDNTISQPSSNEFCGESEALTILGSDALPNEGTYRWEYSLNNGGFVFANEINDQRDYTTGVLGVGEHRFRRVYSVNHPIPCEEFSNTIVLTILPIPVTPTVYSNGPLCEGDDLELFTDFVTNATYEWLGPNGFTSADQNPIMVGTTPAESGSYCVKVTVDGCTSLYGCTDVFIIETPAPPVANNNGPLCEDEDLNLTTVFVVGAIYSWTGPDGFTSNQQNPTILYADPSYNGTYCVVVSVDGCDSEPSCTDVLISPNPIVPIATYNGPLCEGEDLEISVNSISGAAYEWTGSAGFTSNDQNLTIPNISIENAGQYCLIISVDGCESDVYCLDVIINPNDQASTIQASSTICIGEDLELNTETLPNGLYEWTGPNGFQSFDQNPIIPSVTSDNSGIYTLHASNTLSQCPHLGVVVKEIEVLNCFEPYAACDELGPDDFICNYNDLDGLSGSLSSENSIGNQPPGFLCNSNDEAQNISWIGFVALEGDYDIVINTTNCFIDNGIVGGVQIGVYLDCSFSNDSEVFCENKYEFQNETRISSSTLIPGQTYFLFIDGIQSSLCDYSIDIDGFYDNTYCTDLSKVTGVAYVDENENGVYEVGEILLRNALISLSPGNLSVLTNDEGKYIINTPKGGATLTAKMNEGHWINDELTIEDLTIFETCVEGINFGFVANLFYQEANISVANSITRCDWETKFYFTVENTGTIDLDANFEFEFDNKASYFSTNLIGLQVNGSTASGDLGTMTPFEVRQFWITLKMPPGSTVLPVLEFKTTLNNSGGIQMDEYEQSEQLRCSYDPNDKREYPNREGEENLTLMDEDLEYTIRFQNNGNDTAFQVKIIDPLDPNIDPTSIRVINSSHAVETCIENENLIFIFENINLVDSMTNYEGSQGFVSFRCSTKEDRLENTIVHNTADIIFDTNEPIVTNTTINTLVSELCTYVSSEIDIEICEGDNYNGLEESGTYTEIYPLQYGCDSTVIINLEVQGITYSSQNIEVCEGEAFDLNGEEYILYESQILRDSIENAQGCLSNVFIFDVEVNPILMIDIDTVICEGYEYNGLSESGIYTIDSFDEVTGCDIIITIDLEVLPKSDPACIVGIDDLDNSEIKIYPIPARDVFFLEGDVVIDAVSIYTMNYQKIDELQFANGLQKVQLSTDKLIQGLYIVAVESKGQIIYKKLIIE